LFCQEAVITEVTECIARNLHNWGWNVKVLVAKEDKFAPIVSAAQDSKEI
jgi:hypothetical protein